MPPLLAETVMQDKATPGLNGAAEIDGLLAHIIPIQDKVYFFEQTLELDIDGLVDHQAQGTICCVLTQIDNRTGKGVPARARHGNQKLIGEIDVIRHRLILGPVRKVVVGREMVYWSQRQGAKHSNTSRYGEHLQRRRSLQETV